MSSAPFVVELWDSLGGPPELLDRLSIVGRGDLPSVYRVTDLACAMVGAAGLAASELMTVTRADAAPSVVVDRAVASAWYGSAVEPVGWERPAAWDPIAGDYRTRDGWIRLHTNASHHRAAALRVLGVDADRELVAGAVASRDAVDLESSIVEAGGCAAAMRTAAQWHAHPQGVAVAAEPLLDRSPGSAGTSGDRWDPTAERPLAGIRVLDLTRVIAGPVATRFLSSLGADVLRVDPPGWNDDALVGEMTLGKRAARLDARSGAGLERMTQLIAGSDVLVHGYRNGALAALGLPDVERQALRPGLVEASLDAYGFTGQWSHRRGFDSLVQMSSGIAARGMRWAAADEPKPLPVQALDHSAGYLLAAAVLRGLTERVAGGRGVAARTSLARVAVMLVAGGESSADAGPVDPVARNIPLSTAWGPARLLPPPATVAGVRFGFDRGSRPLGSDDAIWAE